MVEVSPTAPVRAMELITILNRCRRFRGFVYQQAHFSADKKSIDVAVRPRKGSVAICSRCHLPAPGYDQLGNNHEPICLAYPPRVQVGCGIDNLVPDTFQPTERRRLRPRPETSRAAYV